MKNWRNMGNRVLSAFLALAMCLGMVCTTAFAEGDENQTGEQAFETLQQDNVQQDNVQQDNVQQDNIQQDNVQQDNIQQDNVQQDNVQQDNVQQDNIQQDNVQQDNIQQDNVQQDNVQQDNVQQDNIQQDNVQQDNTPAPQADELEPDAELSGAVEVSSAEELKRALNSEKVTSITLAGDIDMADEIWVGIALERTLVIDGRGHTISNMHVNEGNKRPNGTGVVGDGGSCDYYAGFIANNKGTLTIQNLTFTGATVDIDPVTVDATSTGSSILAVVCGNNTGTLRYKNVAVDNSTVKGYTKVGILHAYTQKGGSFVAEQCTVTNSTVELEADGTGALPLLSGVLIGYAPGGRSTTKGIAMSGNKVNISQEILNAISDYGYTLTTREDGSYYITAGSRHYNLTSFTYSKNDTDSVSFAAEVGGFQYETLKDAIDAATAGQTVMLLDNVDTGSTYTMVNKAVTLNLNGKTITSAAEFTLACTRNATITNGTVANTQSNNGKAIYVQKANITIDNAIIKGPENGNNGSAGIMLGNGAAIGYWGSATIKNNSNVTGGYSGVNVIGPARNNATTDSSTSTLTVENSAISGNCYGISGNGLYDVTTIELNSGAKVSAAVGIYHPQQGKLTINSGAEVSGQVGVQTCAGETVINDGAVITSTATTSFGDPVKPAEQADGSVQDGSALSVLSRQAYGAVSVVVNGGTFQTGSSENAAVLKYGAEKADNKWTFTFDEAEFKTSTSLKITGGTFSSDVSKYVIEGAQANENNGVWTIGPKADSVAAIGNVGYETLQEAITAAKDGDTVTLLDNVTLDTAMQDTSAILITKDLTLDGGGKTINVSGGLHGVQVYGNVTATIQNVTITGAGKDALLVNGGSTVTVNNLTTSNNNWGAINVDHASTLNFESGILNEANKIWVDGEGSTVTVPSGWNWYDGTQDGKTQRFYTTGLSVSLNQATASLYSNTTPSTVNLTATVTGTLEGKTTTTTWASSDATVATVDAGVVTAVANGTATITATVGGMTATCTVTVSTYTSGGGGSSSGGGGGGGSTNPPVVDIDDPDVPLSELPLPFTDVKDGDWFREAVAFVWNNDLMVGVSGSRFGVKTSTTRSMMATIIYRLEKEPSIAFEQIFSDVSDGNWFSKAITWANANGIAVGYGSGKFGTNDNVTREQLVTMLYRYASQKGFDVSKKSDLSEFADAGKVSSYAEDAMSWAVAEGIVVGRGADKLAPNSLAMRVEVAAIFQRFAARYMTETLV